MSTAIEKTAELAMIKAMPKMMVDSIPPGRLLSLCNRLQKYVDAEFRNIRRLSHMESIELNKRILEFGKRSGWEGKQRHIGTLISFLLDMLENSKYEYHPGITETLVQIFDHIENKKSVAPACMVAGTIATKKWEDCNGIGR